MTTLNEKKPTADSLVFITAGNNKKHFMWDEAIKWLLDEDYLTLGSIWHEDKRLPGIQIYVLCNDLFYWGCADAEPIDIDEVESLYRAIEADPQWGCTFWCCKHRNLQPQVPFKEMLIKEGVWTAELEALPEPEPS